MWQEAVQLLAEVRRFGDAKEVRVQLSDWVHVPMFSTIHLGMLASFNFHDSDESIDDWGPYTRQRKRKKGRKYRTYDLMKLHAAAMLEAGQ
jgi:hypothetical protein